jgi:hypothetical protein
MVKPTPVNRRWRSLVVYICVGALWCRALLAASRLPVSRPSRRGFLFLQGGRARCSDLVRCTLVPNQSIALLRAHAEAMSHAVRVKGDPAPPPAAHWTLMLRCVRMCVKRWGKTPALFDFHLSQPRLQAWPRRRYWARAGAGARHAPGGRATAGIFPEP